MPNDPVSGGRWEPTWIREHVARAIHDRVLAANGGAPGIRDSGLLASALARPQQRFAYDDAADLFTLAALYAAGVVRNHPFIDGNKRTGLGLGLVFLELNGVMVDADQDDLAAIIVHLASGNSDEEAVASYLRAHARRP